MVQWLRTRASTSGSQSSIPGWGTKILHAAWVTEKLKKKKKITIFKIINRKWVQLSKYTKHTHGELYT